MARNRKYGDNLCRIICLVDLNNAKANDLTQLFTWLALGQTKLEMTFNNTGKTASANQLEYVLLYKRYVFKLHNYVT